MVEILHGLIQTGTVNWGAIQSIATTVVSVVLAGVYVYQTRLMGSQTEIMEYHRKVEEMSHNADLHYHLVEVDGDKLTYDITNNGPGVTFGIGLAINLAKTHSSSGTNFVRDRTPEISPPCRVNDELGQEVLRANETRTLTFEPDVPLPSGGTGKLSEVKGHKFGEEVEEATYHISRCWVNPDGERERMLKQEVICSENQDLSSQLR